VAVARNVPEADAEGVVLKFLAAMGAHDDYPIQRVLGLGLANLVSKLSGSQAEAVAKELVSLTQSSTDAYKLEGLGLSLGALPVKLTELQADIATKKFLSAISAAENKNQLDALSHGVTAVVSKVPYTMAGAVLEAFVSAAVDTKTKSTDQLEAFGRGMAALPINLSGEKVGKVIDKFMLIQSELFFESKSLGPGVVAVIGKVVDAQAQDVMDNFVNAILATENPNILNTLGIAVSALPLGLSQTQSEAVAAKYLAEIRSSTKVDFSHTDKMDYAWDQNHEIQRQKNLYVLGEGFAALAGKMRRSDPELAG